jgi:hypothetical protein
MKRFIIFSLAAAVALSFTSCNKSEAVVDPSLNSPEIKAWIHPNVNQPVDAVLGSSASFGIGDKIVVYVPYSSYKDEINAADLIITDDQGTVNVRQQLLESADPAADGLSVPAELQGMQFMYTIIEVDNSFANKNIILSIEVRGMNSSYSTDKIENAFTVTP